MILNKIKNCEGSVNSEQYLPWYKQLVKAAESRLRQDTVRIDLGSGPSAVVANALGGKGWIALDPNYKYPSSADIQGVQGTLQDLDIFADYILFNPPAVDSCFLDSEHRDYPLFNAGKDGLEAIEECLNLAPSKFSQEGELLLIVPSFHKPPKIEGLGRIVLRHGIESIDSFVARAPTRLDVEPKLKGWLQERVQRFEKEWAELGIESDFDHFVMTVLCFRKE